MIGDNIRSRRKALKMSIEELSKKVGVSKQTISRYEIGAINIPSDKIEKIAQALGCTPSYIMGWDEDLEQLINETDPLYETKVGLTKEKYEFISKTLGLSKDAVDSILLIGLTQLTTSTPILTLLNCILAKKSFRDLLNSSILYIQNEHDKEKIFNRIKIGLKPEEKNLIDSFVNIYPEVIKSQFIDILDAIKKDVEEEKNNN